MEPRTFGTRRLTDNAKVLDFNAWDHVEWDQELLDRAAERIALQTASPVDHAKLELYADERAASHWNAFYELHREGFFKDRRWLKEEFPELIDATRADAGPKVICDVGAAVGNTIFPLLEGNANPALQIHALDYSAVAIETLRSNPAYDEHMIRCEVWDMADPEGPPLSVQSRSVDICVLIFAFSALSPAQWRQAAANIHTMLKPGGLLLLRDYGRFDLTQLRFKANRLLSPSFYVRGDGTRVYFFTSDELTEIFAAFAIWQNDVDKRLLVNRKEDKKMYRAWVQLKARRR